VYASAVTAPRRASPWVAVPAALALAYALAVVIAAWRAPDKGFQAFIGHRVVHVEAGGPAEAAGIREDDRIVAIDGVAVTGTFDYAARTLDRSPGETVRIGVERDGRALELPVRFETAPPPWSAIVATLLAAMLLALGLIARTRRPDDLDARRLYRSNVVFAILYVGALSWSRLVVHPVLGIVFVLALFVGPTIALDLSLDFPHREGRHRAARRWRALGYTIGGLLGVTCCIALGVAIADFLADRGDRALPWVVGCIAAQIAVIPLHTAVGLTTQIRAHRAAHGLHRAQLRWLLFVQAMSAIPVVAAIPVAFADLDRFLIVRYQPFVVAIAVAWAVGYGIAVLRFRLADVDAMIERSAGYALATGAAGAVYVGVVLAAGWITGRLVGDAGPWPHLGAALAAVATFGPLRARLSGWIDRRFFRDRRHYVEALRRAGESLAVLREPDDLAREAVTRIAGALHAAHGALYVRDDGTWRLAHAIGDVTPPAEPQLPAPPDGIAVPLGAARADDTSPIRGWLVLGPRRSGDLYSSQDRDLLGALASQLATALANARAFGTITEMSRTLEGQNVEIRELRDRLEDENRFLRRRVEAATDGATVVGDAQATRELKKQLELVARSDASVLVLGESGTGKGLVARTLHAMSPRADGPFMHVDCGAIPASVFESELFGHERGAFTGAVRTRRGPIELAAGGTLFLDEIGELPLELQPKLLRVLEERVIVRVGATAPVAVDLRIIAATHRALDQMVARGEFREDLYFRLRVVELTVPALRARRADLPALCEVVMARASRRAGRPARPLAADALAAMSAYAWPGNVRELENVLERALVLGGTGAITEAELALPEIAPAPEIVAAAGDESRPHDAVMDEIERRRLTAALTAASGNQSGAAKALGMPRTTFINKLRRHGLL
jgi:transcriptional regulator with GAF, ATPase, and Fis domain